MADPPARPPVALPPLAPGWTEHKAPSGHAYYYNKETKSSTYVRPVANPQPSFFAASAPPAHGTHPTLGADANLDLFNPVAAIYSAQRNQQQQRSQYRDPRQRQWTHVAPPQQQPFRGGMGGGRGGFSGSRRQPEDRPKHRHDIPNCAPWVLVKTKLGRRFVWNRDTNESFWKFPADVMKGVVEFDRVERERRERRERSEASDEGEDDTMADIEADLAATEENIEQAIVEVDGEEGMGDESEYEEVEVTDDEGEDAGQPSKRQRTEEPTEDQPMEMGEDDMAWQLAQLEDMEADFGEEDEEEGLPLTEEDCKALFKELLDDLGINPYTPWEKTLDSGTLYEDERYKALPNMKARKECFNEWARDKIQFLKEQKAKMPRPDPKVEYLSLLSRLATPNLYWPEFRRKFKKEPEMKDAKLSDKEKEKLYRDHIKRLGMKPSELKSDLSALLKAQPLAALNRDSTLDTLPPSVSGDLRFISLPGATRDALVETYISTLPPAPEGAAKSAEEEAEVAKRRAERERREWALAERERRVREEKRKQEREMAYGKGRLRDNEEELHRALRVGKDGLRAQLDE
ncbi:hypothetical protein K491DRAFT_758658 [Lophiostoma macrostomum CBS 122681]|uniref:WW domain-containing protein n=1 Tax=Lophiostoma macrostomum CBS 122681 TaxID=1314788 RepID=A0A6A6T6E6_9PLEO|nr:hypothetical protein K491DRAFT_758658 [Lophiostoma macrostomum CBS 122681]